MKSFLALAITVFVLVGAIAMAKPDGSTIAEPAECGSLSNDDDFRRLMEAYTRIKRATGRDPSIYAVSAEIGLNLHCQDHLYRSRTT